MDIGELTQQQAEQAFKLCDIMNLEDFTIAVSILSSFSWDFDKAVFELSQVQQTYKKQPSSHKQPQQPEQYIKPPHYEEYTQPNNFEYHGQFEEEYANYEDYQYEYEDADFENKRKIFQDEYPTLVPLNKTTSQTSRYGTNGIGRKNQGNESKELLEHAEQLCTNILKGNDLKMQRYNQSQSKLQNNKKFMVYLHQHYNPRISFTFGTFYLNLIRAYLENKIMLVYIHQEQEADKAIGMILSQRDIARFVNLNCIVYGTMDNSDDYEILQKYVPISKCPAFALFKFDRKTKKEVFVTDYVVLQKEETNFLQWISNAMGIKIKKKNIEKSSIKQPNSSVYSITDIINEQNLQYEETLKFYQIKREKSKLVKVHASEIENDIAEKKPSFDIEPALGENTITIKFRLPVTGKSVERIFEQSENIQRLFDYVHCFYRDKFEERYADFNLRQTFPQLSLKGKEEKTIAQIFEGSNHQNIIIKEE